MTDRRKTSPVMGMLMQCLTVCPTSVWKLVIVTWNIYGRLLTLDCSKIVSFLDFSTDYFEFYLICNSTLQFRSANEISVKANFFILFEFATLFLIILTNLCLIIFVSRHIFRLSDGAVIVVLLMELMKIRLK